jgi:plasmid stabilization system protein ParE
MRLPSIHSPAGWLEHYQRDDIREAYEGRYRMIYRVLPDRIDILTVRHGARLLPERLRNL